MNTVRIFFLLLFISSLTLGQEGLDTIPQLNWIPTYKEALKRAKKEDKPVLIYFKGSDWCGPCKIIERDLFGTKKFTDLAKSELIMLEVDIPRDMTILTPEKLRDNLTVKQKYRVKKFPTLLFVNHRGRKIDVKSGYILTEYYFPFIQNVIYKYKKS